MSTAAYYDLVLAATGSKAEAERRAKAHRMARMRAESETA